MEEQVKPILRQLKPAALFDYERAKVKVYSHLDKEEPKKVLVEVVKGCAQAIFVDFQKSSNVDFNGEYQLKFGLFFKNLDDVKYNFNECYAEMTISLTDFVNPFKGTYSKLEYIELYVRLLQKIGFVCAISSITTTKLSIIIDYSKIDWNEEAFLKFTWQAIRNLHVNFCSHVPVRFIELAELFPDKDLFLLLQVAYRLTPYQAITDVETGYSIAHGNSIFQPIRKSLSEKSPAILVQRLYPKLNVTNYREIFKNQSELTKALLKTPNTLGEEFTKEDYEKQYNKLVNSTTKKELWANIEKLIIKNKKVTKKQTLCLQTI